jgi:signal transduction histidine kinase
LGKYTGVCRIYIFEDYGNGKMSANTFEWCKSGIPARKEENKRLAYNIHLPNWKGLLIKDGIIYFNDLQKTPSDLKALLESRLVKSMIVLPIYIDNDFYGFLGFDHCIQLHTWNSMEIGFLKTISIILSNTFERRITEEERKQMEREILSTIIQTEEKERGRIARDLHDGLGPLLSSLKLYAKILGNADETKKRAEILVTTNEVIDESLLMIKEISNNLSPHVLNDFGLAAAIQSFCKKMTLTKAIDINFDSNVYDLRFEINVELVLFRILKELVNNTIKHALASRIEIFLLKTENLLSLIYSDDGTGFDIKKVLDNHITGMGISNIINRIGSINGKLMFESQAEKGIQVKISVALNK